MNFEFGDYEEINEKKALFSLDKFMNKKVLSLVILIVLLLIIAIIFLNSNKEYQKIERQLVNSARNYIRSNNIVVNKEIYIDTKKINVEVGDDCLLTSGVIYDGNEYIPNLLCKNYQSKILKNDSNSIELLGEDIVVIPKGMIYYEQGYKSKNDVDIVGEVGSESGIYNLYYVDQKNNSSVLRKVIVIDDREIYNLFPELTLNGTMLQGLKINSNYEDLGAKANDIIDGDITNKIKIDNYVNTKIQGEYKVIYSITNSRGYTTTVVRNLLVSNNPENIVSHLLIPSSTTGSNVTIIISITDDNFDYVELPNAERKKEKYINYVVSENGRYKFIVHDKQGRTFEKVVDVSNIKKSMIEGSCTAVWKSDYTEVNVDIKNTIISSYEYIIDDKTESISVSKNFKSKTLKPNNVKVKLKDFSGNESEIICAIEDKREPRIYQDSHGRNCIEGFICYLQYDYAQKEKYPFCSMNDKPNTCGGISRNGCSITSASIAIAAFKARSSNGEIYNPFTVWEELYPINKTTGQCNGSCSGWTSIRTSIINAGLSAPKHYASLSRTSFAEIREHLKKGYPIVVHASTGPYASGTGHYMTLLAIRSDDYVFLSSSSHPDIKGNDPTIAGKISGKQFYANTFIPINDLIDANIDGYLLVGPAGLF